MSDRPVPHVWAYAVATSWAILPERLPVIMEIAARENLDIEAVAARLGHDLDNARAATIRDGVAIIPIEGTIFPRAGLFAQISGGVSTDEIAQDLATALDNPTVTGIVLAVDSPGGDVNGIAETAAMIRAATARKPIVAYVRDLGASAAYWIAAAADEVVVASTALVGSIGIVGTVADPSKQTTRSIEFVSSQSPHKRPDPTTQAGGARIQARVDELADLFIADVARYRGVTPETVAADFGQGDVLVGQRAVGAGLADRVGSFEGVVAELQARAREPRRISGGGRMAAQAQGGSMPEQTRMQRFMAWLGGEGDDSAFAAANIAASGQPSPATAPVAAAAGGVPITYDPTMPRGVVAESPGGGIVVAPVGADHEKELMRAEIERLRAAEATRQRASIDTAAQAFAEAEIRAGRALPAEQDALVAAYADAATDDADHPRAEGRPTRVAALVERQGARPAHGLTREMVPVRAQGDGTLTVLDNPRATRQEGDPAPMTPERWRSLYAHTATGKAILAEHGIPATGDLSAAHREILTAIIQQKGLAPAQ